MRRGARILSTALITAGVVVLLDVGLTVVWQEPVSAAWSAIQQSRADEQLEELEANFLGPGELAALRGVRGDARRARILAGRFAGEISEGDAIGRIRVPSIDLDAVMMQGTETATLQRGPGHYANTALPGRGSTVGIAGHRTTYLAPFRHIDEIDDGDEIRLELPYAAFTYRVQFHRVVDPSDVEIVRPLGYERLVLTACHPLYSAAERWAVFATLQRIDTFALATAGAWPVN